DLAGYGSYRFTWFFGDGEFMEYTQTFSRNAPVVTTVQHTYFNKVDQSIYGPNDVYVEVTGGAYDELDPPKRADFIIVGPNPGTPFETDCTNCSVPTNNVFSPNGIGSSSPLTVIRNRSFVRDHHITFIISVLNNCQVETNPPVTAEVSFYFDSSQLTPEDPSNPFIVFDATDKSPSSFNSPWPQYDSHYKWEMTNLKRGEVRNIFVRMRVQANMLPRNLIFTRTELNFLNTNCPGPVNPQVPKGVVDNSHDPNILTSDMEHICPDLLTDSIRYTVQFRNDGTGPADTVFVKTIIPDQFDMSSIKVIYPVQGLDPPSQNINGLFREVEWTLTGPWLKNNRTLRGTREPEFGRQFLMDATVDSVVFEVAYLPNYQPRSCDAIINQAEVIFDCNPSIFTGPYIYRFDCVTDTIIDLQTGVPDTSFKCTICEEILDYNTEQDTFFACDGPVTLDDYDESRILYPNTTNYYWYPPATLSGINVPKPSTTPRRNTEFFMVAYSPEPCFRTIYRYPVVLPCDMEIVPTIICNQQNEKQVTATVSGTYMSGALKWNNCELTDTLTSPWLTQRQLYLTVVDTTNNCYADIVVDLTSCPVSFPVDPPILIGVILTVSLLIGLIVWRRRP
ncbi:MAG: hypothetical protein AAF985_22280, partial [Bacteroidota bacterium]